jgi:hypothetical protein
MKQENVPTPPQDVPSPENKKQPRQTRQIRQGSEKSNQLPPAPRGPLQRRADQAVSAREGGMAMEAEAAKLTDELKPIGPLQTCGDLHMTPPPPPPPK